MLRLMYPRVVRLSVTLVHHGRNEMPFGRDTHVVPSNIVLDDGRSLFTGKKDLGVETPIAIAAISQQP